MGIRIEHAITQELVTMDTHDCVHDTRGVGRRRCFDVCCWPPHRPPHSAVPCPNCRVHSGVPCNARCIIPSGVAVASRRNVSDSRCFASKKLNKLRERKVDNALTAQKWQASKHTTKLLWIQTWRIPSGQAPWHLHPLYFRSETAPWHP